MNLVSLTSYINAFAFPLTAFLELSGSKTNKNDKIATEIKNVFLLIFLIATISYIVINYYSTESSNSNNTNKNIAEASRYIDWLLTTPLLGYVYYLLGVKYSNYKGSPVPFFILPLFMILFGYLALYNKKFYIISFIFLILFFNYVRSVQVSIQCYSNKCVKKSLNIIPYFFYIGWTLYGLAFLIPNVTQQIVSYNILDFVNKIIFSILIVSIIKKY